MPTHRSLLLVFFVEIVISTRSEFDNDLNNLTETIIRDHFHKPRCITYITNEGLELQLGETYAVINIRLPAERETLSGSFEQNCGGYVIRVRNESAAIGMILDAKHHTTGSRYNNHRYLFLPADDSVEHMDIINDSRLFFFPNMVMVTPGKNTLYAVTHTILDHHKREVLGIAHEVLDEWMPGRGFRYGRDLYPDKVSNVMGKKFVFAVLNYSPFSIVRSEGNVTMFDGFETRIAAEFVKFLNGTWEGMDHLDLWGEIFPNGTGNGVVGSVVSHVADFGFSAFYQWFCDDCDCTYPFYQSAVTCLVPRPEMVSGWLTIVLPFETDTWVVLIVVYLISSTFLWGLIFVLQSGTGLDLIERIGMAASDSFFTNFRLQLEQIPVTPKRGPLSIYVKISVYYYFFVAAFWQGGIASILTVPRFEKPINDAMDLVERWPKVKWGANSNAWINSIRASTEPHLMEIARKFVTLDDETLSRKTKTRDFGFFLEKLPHGHYGYSNYITEESMKYLRLMESSIYTAFGVIILPRGSPFSEKFDRMLLRLYDAGIIHKMEVQVSLERINNRLQNMIESSNLKETNTVILAVRHIQGPIFIYLGGMSLAGVVFFFEVCFCERSRLIRIHD